MISLALVDDHNLVRQALAAHFNSLPEVKVVAQYNSGADFLKALDEQFDIVFLDINLGNENGLEVLASLRELHKDLPVVMLTANVSAFTLSQALAAKATGFVSKESDVHVLTDALRVALQGDFFLDPALDGLARQAFLQGEKAKLSNREVEVIRHLAAGLSYKEIGEKLFISARTVEAHRNNILQKLELQTVVELVRYALKNHIID